MNPTPEFSSFEIVYDPVIVGATLSCLALFLLFSGLFLRRRSPAAARGMILCAPAVLLIWGTWEGIVAWWGLDSVLGFFVLMATATGIGAAIGWSLKRSDA